MAEVGRNSLQDGHFNLKHIDRILNSKKPSPFMTNNNFLSPKC